MKYGIIKVKRAFLYEENGGDVVDEVFFGWSVMWEDEGEWIEVWTHYGYRGWMERNLIEEKSREWMEEREKAGNTYVVTRGFADVMRGARALWQRDKKLVWPHQRRCDIGMEVILIRRNRV